MSQFKADLFAVYCAFVTFPGGVLRQVWCLIVSIRDASLLSYFDCQSYSYFMVETGVWSFFLKLMSDKY